VGALIAQKWNFSWEMVETIAYHHSPEAETSGSPLSAILAISNDICKRMGVGIDKVGDGIPLSETWPAKALSLNESACTQVAEVLRAMLEEEKKLYEV
jgi:HD-like signal output (HDOD) protein